MDVRVVPFQSFMAPSERWLWDLDGMESRGRGKFRERILYYVLRSCIRELFGSLANQISGSDGLEKKEEPIESMYVESDTAVVCAYIHEGGCWVIYCLREFSSLVCSFRNSNSYPRTETGMDQNGCE